MSLEPITAIAPKAIEALKDPSLRWLFFPGLMKKALLSQKISELEVEQSAQEWKARQNADRQFLSMLRNFSPEQAGLAERAHASFAAERIEAQANRESIAVKTYCLLKECDSAEMPPLDSDFIKRFYSYAGEISKDDAQTIWAKLLAGEIAQPGKFSLNTLDILRNLTQEQAQAIVGISKYIFGDGIMLQYSREERVKASPFSDELPRIIKEGIPNWQHVDEYIDKINFLGLISPRRDYVELIIKPGEKYEFKLNSGSICVMVNRDIFLRCFYLPASKSYFELLSLHSGTGLDAQFIEDITKELIFWGHNPSITVNGKEFRREECPGVEMVFSKYFFYNSAFGI